MHREWRKEHCNLAANDDIKLFSHTLIVSVRRSFSRDSSARCRSVDSCRLSIASRAPLSSVSPLSRSTSRQRSLSICAAEVVSNRPTWFVEMDSSSNRNSFYAMCLLRHCPNRKKQQKDETEGRSCIYETA